MHLNSLFLSTVIGSYIAPFIVNYEIPCLVIFAQLIAYYQPRTILTIIIACLSFNHQQSYTELYNISLRQWTKIRQNPGTCNVLIRHIPKSSTQTMSLRGHIINCNGTKLQPANISLQIKTPQEISVGNTLKVLTHKCQLDFDDYHYQQQPLQRYSQALISNLHCHKQDSVHISPPSPNIVNRYWQLRGVIIEYLITKLKHSPAFGLIAALLFGEQQFINIQEWHALKITSTAHLVAISGLHIQMIASTLEIILTFVHNKLYPNANKVYINAIVLSIITLYYALSGLSYSCQRALLMYTYKYLCQLTNTLYQPLHALGTSACIAIALHPYCVFNMGFILSYAMVLSLIIIGQHHPHTNYVSSAYWTFIAQIPWSYWFWKKFAILSPLGNSFALPWLSFGILPCVLLLIPATMLSQSCIDILLWLIETQWYYLYTLLNYITYFDL